jgi:hypothetical protein
MMSRCKEVTKDIASGKCRRNVEGKVILPSGAFPPRDLPGVTMAECIAEWHKCNPSQQDDLNIPKFHSLDHYIQSIKLLGTTDNYNMEAFEHLHIDFAKEGWWASNTHNAFPWSNGCHTGRRCIHFKTMSPGRNYKELTDRNHSHVMLMAKFSHFPSILLSLTNCYLSLNRGILLLGLHLPLRAISISFSARNALMHNLPFQRLYIYHTFKFHPVGLEEDEEVCDVIKAAPPGKKRPAWFDTAIVLHTDDAKSTGLEDAAFKFFMIILYEWYNTRYKDWKGTCDIHTSSSPRSYHHHLGPRHH